MSDQRGGGIAWCDETWNPIRGCTVVSPGCANCYAMRQAARMAGAGGGYEGLVRGRRGLGGESRPIWTGIVRAVPARFADPLRWTRPRRVFVNSMSDLFHEALPPETIAALFAVMALAGQHTFQILTKRPEQARAWFAWAAAQWPRLFPPGQHEYPPLDSNLVLQFGREDPDFRRRLDDVGETDAAPWPLPNAWVGVSAEDQRRADERIPQLLELPAAVRWVSLEPLLGPISMAGWLSAPRGITAPPSQPLIRDPAGTYLDWVVVGGESNPGARPCDVAWIRAIVRQCAEAGVPCFVKQLGANVVTRNDDGVAGGEQGGWPNRRDGSDPIVEALTPQGYQGDPARIYLEDPKGADPAEWPEDLRRRRFPR